jgi:hypothetical protein
MGNILELAKKKTCFSGVMKNIGNLVVSDEFIIYASVFLLGVASTLCRVRNKTPTLQKRRKNDKG